MRIKILNTNELKDLIFTEVDYREYLVLFDLCKREKYTMVIEPVDDWD